MRAANSPASRYAAGDVAVVLILAFAAIAAYGPHVLGGGFYSDDWNFSADYAQASEDGFVGGLSGLFDTSVSRPVGTLYSAIRSALFGLDPTGHLIVAALLGLAVAGLFYAVLRMLGMPVVHAAAIALLALLFPLADAARLWATASAANLGISLYLGGVLLALAGLRSAGLRSWTMHLVATVLYAVSALTYELTVFPVLLSFLLYRTQTPWKQALTRWAVDAGTIVAVLALATAQTTVPREPLSSLPGRVLEVTEGALAVVSWSVVPLGNTTDLSAARVLGGLVVLVVLCAAVAQLLKSDRAAELRPWLIVGGAGALAIVAGYLVLVPATGYNPAHRGIANRVNAFSSLGVAAFVYSLCMLAALQVSWLVRRSATALAVGLAAVLAAGYAVQLYKDERDWRDAAVAQERVLEGLQESPRPRAGSRLVAFDVPAFAAPGVPVFHESWDLSGALRIRWDDDSIEAYPVNNGRVVVCRAEQAYISRRGEVTALPYGRVRFSSAESARSTAIDSHADCRAWLQDAREKPI